MTGGTDRVEAVVFDLLFTLVQPGTFPGGVGRVGWLAGLLGVSESELAARWHAFVPVLESGHAPGNGGHPELEWVRRMASEFGVKVTPAPLAEVEADWDLTRRQALLDPPAATIEALEALRAMGLRIGVLSDTHGLELRAWARSPVAPLVDEVALSHEIGVCKPDRAAYRYVSSQLGVRANKAVYVGDGGSDELWGAREAGFRLVVLAEEAPRRLKPNDLPRLRDQADTAVPTLAALPKLIEQLNST